MKKKIAFIVQRYGLEVNGGAEYHCRILAEHLAHDYQITILTSCAKSYITWADEYPAGVSQVNGLDVIRFASAAPANARKKFRSINRKFKKRKPYQKVLKFLRLYPLFEKIFPQHLTPADANNWAILQGPYIPGLVEYLKEDHNKYDALIFFTYLYYPTIEGIKVAPKKSILIPTAHDETPIYFPFFKTFFNTPQAILYNTLSEKRFVNHLTNNRDIYSDIVGIGVEALKPFNTLSVNEILKTDDEYLLYVGRIDAAKGCKILCDYFIKYINDTGRKLKLVLVGQAFMVIPQHPDIIITGFVEEDVKITLLKNAKALAMPSFYESLSMVTLESMAYGVPVIANEACEVLKDHIDNSKAGFVYHDFEGFKSALDELYNADTNLLQLSKNAKDYVAANYSWGIVLKKVSAAIDYIGMQC